MFVRDNVTSVIHISDKSASYLKDNNIDNNKNENLTINTAEMISLLFDCKSEKVDNNKNEITIINDNEGNEYFDIDTFKLSEDNKKIVDTIEKNKKVYDKLLKKNFTSFKDRISVNSEIIFQKWKESFSNLSYKNKDLFKQLVVFEENIKIEEMETNIRNLIGDISFGFYKTDAKNFSSNIKSIEQENLQNYYNK